MSAREVIALTENKAHSQTIVQYPRECSQRINSERILYRSWGVIGESVYPVNLIEKPRTLIKHTSGMSGKMPYESED